MATRNTAKYGGELARLLIALTATPEGILKTQATLIDILDKVFSQLIVKVDRLNIK